jgi:hypothetical protein
MQHRIENLESQIGMIELPILNSHLPSHSILTKYTNGETSQLDTILPHPMLQLQAIQDIVRGFKLML